MSIRLRLKYRYRGIVQYFLSLRLPDWLVGFWARVIVTALVVVAGAGYLFQVNNLSTQGYVIHTLQNQVDALQQNNEQLQTTIASYQSLSSIESRLQGRNMVTVASIQYLSHDSGTVVAER